MAKLTIGVPVRNGAHFLEKFFDSIKAQVFTDYLIIISDNASEDNTSEICQNQVKNDPRISYHRHSSDIGVAENFDFVLSLSDSEYFTWWAVDDLRAPDNLSLNVDFLDEYENFVGSGSAFRFDTDCITALRCLDASDDNPQLRVLKIVENFNGTSGLSFSIFRTALLKEFRPPFFNGNYYANDISRLIFLLKKNKIHTFSSKGIVTIAASGISNSKNPFSKYRHSTVELLLPYYYVSLYILRMTNFKPNIKLKIILNLLKINLSALNMNISRLIISTLATRKRGFLCTWQ